MPRIETAHPPETYRVERVQRLVTSSSPNPFSHAERLLAAANRASEKVAVLHIAFLALCTYVLVIVFSTTDMDLLIGKRVKLPVIDVDVSITGFYALAPYLLILFHFNLLLQLQLLSRKLFAFDDAAPKEGGLGSLHDQLHIFPYNYYLVGRPSPLVHHLVAVLVNVSILVLPLLSILILEARFLAYQSEAITWIQRLAIWLDVGLVATLWPVSMDRQDSWKKYMFSVGQSARLHWMCWTWNFFGLVILTCLFTIPLPKLPDLFLWFTILMWLLLSLLASPLRYGVRWLSRGQYCAINHDTVPAMLGMRGLVTIILLGLPLPLLITVDGESLDLPKMLGAKLLTPWRHLDLHEQVLLAKPIKPETRADLKSYDPAKVESAMLAIERIDLKNRSLRHANLRLAVMVQADLRGAQLQEADLSYAQLQQAFLWKAQLEGAQLNYAELQGAFMQEAQLQGTWFFEAQLQGAHLNRAQLQGAILSEARLQGADLREAQLQGAGLNKAQLQGADLREAQLQGADLEKAQLQGADLRQSIFYGKSLALADVRMVDARGLQWQPLSQKEMENLRTNASKWIMLVPFSNIQSATTPGLEPPEITSCLRDDKTELQCAESYSLDKIRKTLEPELEKLVCLSKYTANGILARYDNERDITDSVMAGFLTYLDKKLEQSKSKYECLGLAARTEVNTVLLKKYVEMERRNGGAASGMLPQPDDVTNH